MKPLVSIIIPFYNTPAKEFHRCIDSLKKQRFSDFEAIIIDDGSSETCLEYLDAECKNDARLRIVHKKNEGSAIARNVGIVEAQGEYIMFLDSDDALTDCCLEEAARIVNECHPDLVIGGVKKVAEDEIDAINLVSENSSRILQVKSRETRNLLMEHMIGLTDKMFTLQNGYIADGPVAKFVKRIIVNEAKFTEENMWNDDTIWNTKMLSKCNNIVIIDSLWYKYLIYPQSKTRRFRPNCPYEFAYRTKQEIDLFKELWPDCMQGIYVRVFNDITLLCRTYLFHPDNAKSHKEKYHVYKECIHKEAYREALKSLEFTVEKRLFNRTIKELLRFSAYYGPHYISYWILWSFYHLRKNQL